MFSVRKSGFCFLWKCSFLNVFLKFRAIFLNIFILLKIPHYTVFHGLSYVLVKYLHGPWVLETLDFIILFFIFNINSRITLHMVTLLPTDYKIPEFDCWLFWRVFSSGELFHNIYVLDICEFQCPLSIIYPVLSSVKPPWLCSSNCVCDTICGS